MIVALNEHVLEAHHVALRGLFTLRFDGLGPCAGRARHPGVVIGVVEDQWSDVHVYAVSAERAAFNEVEKKFLASLAGIIAVALGVWSDDKP